MEEVRSLIRRKMLKRKKDEEKRSQRESFGIVKEGRSEKGFLYPLER
jgi:hypothetical protein